MQIADIGHVRMYPLCLLHVSVANNQAQPSVSAGGGVSHRNFAPNHPDKIWSSLSFRVFFAEHTEASKEKWKRVEGAEEGCREREGRGRGRGGEVTDDKVLSRPRLLGPSSVAAEEAETFLRSSCRWEIFWWAQEESKGAAFGTSA